MYCSNCGAQVPDDVSFCTKCGKSIKHDAGKSASASSGPVIAPSGAQSLKCPSCGAPIAPKFGEAVITCEYCGSGVTLGSQGWTNIQKQTVLTLKVATADQAKAIIKPLINNGILHRHRLEDSKEEELSLTYVPYWIVSVSARTSITVANQNAQLAQTAASAALLGVILGGMGGGFGGGGGGRGGGRGGRRAFDGQVALDNPFAGILGLKRIPIMAFGMGMGRGGGGNKKAEQMDENYYFPVIALKAYPDYQPQNYQFNLEGRELFDITKLPKGIKILNGDVNEDSAKSQAKTLVDQLQSEKAHAKYQAIQSIKTDCDVGDTELLHVPVWFAKYTHKKDKIVLVIDANSSKVINSQGL